MDDLDAIPIDSTRDQRIANGLGDRDEQRDAPTVLDPTTRDERNAPGHDQRDVPLSHQRGQRHGMRASIVGVDDVRAPGLDSPGDLSRRSKVPIAGGADSGNRQPRRTGPSEEGRVGRRHDERFVTCVSLGSGEEVDLPLSAAPRLPHVDVQYPQRHTVKFAPRLRQGNVELWINRLAQQVQSRVVRY